MSQNRIKRVPQKVITAQRLTQVFTKLWIAYRSIKDSALRKRIKKDSRFYFRQYVRLVIKKGKK